jgi:hypothetical protein
MTEPQSPPPEGQQAEQDAKTFDAEYVDKLRKEAAKYRTEAKANADAAKRLADIEDSQKSDAVKADERIAKAEQRAIEAEARAIRREVALDHALTREDADLLDSLTDEDAMRRLATRLASAAADKTKNGNYAPREGNNPSAPDNSDAQFARSLFADGG